MSHSGTHATVASFGTAVMTAVIITVTLRVSWGPEMLWLQQRITVVTLPGTDTARYCCRDCREGVLQISKVFRFASALLVYVMTSGFRPQYHHRHQL